MKAQTSDIRIFTYLAISLTYCIQLRYGLRAAQRRPSGATLAGL